MLDRKWSGRLLLTSLGVVGLMGLSARAQPAIEYMAGHGDMGVAYEDDELELHYHFDTTTTLDGVQQTVETEFDPGEVFTRVPDSSTFSRNALPDFDFIGIGAGENYWVLPQGNTTGVPFFGTAAEEVGASGDWDGDIVYEVTGITRPSGSHFSLYQVDSASSPAPTVVTSDGLSDTLDVPVGSHSHHNWAFTKPGVYQMEITAMGTRASSGQTVQDTEVFWFAVGDGADPAAPTLYDYEYGHGHLGLNFNVNPAPDGTPLNNDGGLFPHVGIPGAGPNSETNLPRNGPFNPAEVTHIVPDSTRADRGSLHPDVDAVLGPVTDDVWVLPESSTEAANKNAPWTGPAVNPDAYAMFDDLQGDDGDSAPQGNVQWTLTHVAGPGEVALWTNDPGGNPDLWMASGDGLDPVGGDDTVLLGPGGAHNNWAFTELGLYHLTFQWDVMFNGESLRESATFAFDVVPEPGTLMLLAAGGCLLGSRRLRERA